MNMISYVYRSGAGNALSELLYGTGKFKGAGDALIRGARTGAVMAGLENISDTAGAHGVAGEQAVHAKTQRSEHSRSQWSRARPERNVRFTRSLRSGRRTWRQEELPQQQPPQHGRIRHGKRFDYLREITRKPLTRREARAIEQVLIERNPQFSNKINSISPKREWYADAKAWGEIWVKRHHYLKLK